jgi:hypothetical protein
LETVHVEMAAAAAAADPATVAAAGLLLPCTSVSMGMAADWGRSAWGVVWAAAVDVVRTSLDWEKGLPWVLVP